jgi:hypothetical protein
VAKLVDALVSEASGSNTVLVQVQSWAPQIRSRFGCGFFCFGISATHSNNCYNKLIMKQLLHILLPVLGAFVLAACGEATATAENAASEESTTETPASYTASFFLKNEAQEEDMPPTAELWVRVNDRELMVKDITGGMDELSSDYWDGEPVPADVLAACVVHYGESDYYYVLIEDDDIVVKNGYTVVSPDTGILLVASDEMLRTPF